MSDPRRCAPATERNREVIASVLEKVLPEAAPGGSRLLEVGCGTGEHAAHLAHRFRGWRWLPTDAAGEALQSADAWRKALAAEQVDPAQRLDVCDADGFDPGPLPIDAVFCANVIHIAPLEGLGGFMRTAGGLLSQRGVVVTYGPYRIDGAHTAASNARFDEWLKAQDSRFGVRDLVDVRGAAEAEGLRLQERIAVPANNFVLVFRRAR